MSTRFFFVFFFFELQQNSKFQHSSDYFLFFLYQHLQEDKTIIQLLSNYEAWRRWPLKQKFKKLGMTLIEILNPVQLCRDDNQVFQIFVIFISKLHCERSWYVKFTFFLVMRSNINIVTSCDSLIVILVT